MKTFFNYLLYIVMLLSITVNAQNNQKYSGVLSEIYSGYTGKNLKGPVKAVYFKQIEPKQSLSEEEQGRAYIYNDIQKSGYIDIDTLGRIKTLSKSIAGDTYLSDIDHETTDDYTYDDKDWIEKSKYKTALKNYFPVSNNNLLLKLNRIEVPKKDDVFEEGGKIWQEYNEDIYIYIYDKLGRIAEEQGYTVFRFGKATLNKKHKEEDLFTRKLFTYNEKGQVVNQKIIPGLYGKDMPYTDMGSECGFCDDLQLKYAYDPLGRITQVIMYGCGRIVVQKDYSYHPTKDYVEKVKFYVTGPGEMSNPTKRFIKTYNEQGDIIKKEYVPDYPEQRFKEKTRYYTYEYDSHNNWIKCNMYLEGTKEGAPTLVGERKIEYYK